MFKRRAFLTALTGLALPVYFSRRSFLFPAESQAKINSKNLSKKYQSKIFIPRQLQFGSFSQLAEVFVNKLNEEFADIHFAVSDQINQSQIILSSPSMDHHGQQMLFVCRTPGGLNRNDFQNWLNSQTARAIYQSAYAKKDFYPIFLCLGPATNHQPVTTSKDYKSQKILFGSSVANSFRSAMNGFEIQNLATLDVARKRIESAQILSLEALQPRVAATFKSSEVVLFKDGLASQPQIYQALIQNQLWNSLNLQQKDFLVKECEAFGKKMDAEIVQTDFAFKDNIATDIEISKMPEIVLALRESEAQFATHFIRNQVLDSKMTSLYEEFESFRQGSRLPLS